MIFEKLRKKKDWEDNPYEGCSYFVIKKSVSHQGLGGKKAYMQFRVPIEEIMEKAEEGNWACCNFVERRPDIFKLKTDPLDKRPSGDHVVYTGDEKMEFFYVKAYTSPEHLGGRSAWLGYIISKDEIESTHLEEVL